MADDKAGFTIDEEYLVEKYEGVPLPDDKPVEVIRIKNGEIVERTLYPPTLDASMVNVAVLGGAADNG